MKRAQILQIAAIAAVILVFSLVITFAMADISFYHPDGNNVENIKDTFSARSAYAHLKYLADKPHPRGSEEHKKVREYIIKSIKDLGLEPFVQTSQYTDQYLISKPSELTNVMTRINGSNSSGALLVVSHYDSVSEGPGASDDAMAVASMLETARIVKEEDNLDNDIIFLFTDGEEEGLLGAEHFVKKHSWMKDVRFVLNFEARGTTGPVLMFETSHNDFASVREFAKLDEKTISNSLLKEMYKLLRNNTDYTCFSLAGIQGLNFAFIEKGYHYHTPLDSIENIDMRTFEQQGDIMLSAIRHFGSIDLKKLESDENAVFFNIFDWFYIVYPQMLAVIFAIATVLIFIASLWAGFRRKYLGVKGILTGFFVQGAVCVAIYFILPFIQKLMTLFSVDLERKINGGIYSTNWLHFGFIFISLAIVTAIYAVAGRRAKPQNLLAGNILWWTLLTIGTTVLAPTGNYLFTAMAFAQTVVLMALVYYSNRNDEEDIKGFAFSAFPVILFVPVYLPVIVLAGEGLASFFYKFTAIFSILIFSFLLPFYSNRTKKMLIASVLILAAGFTFIAVDHVAPGVDINDPRVNLSGRSDNRIRYISDRAQDTYKWAICDDDTYYAIKRFDADKYERQYIDYGPMSWLKDAPDLNIPEPQIKLLSDEKNNGLRTIRIDVKAVQPGSTFYLIAENKDGHIKKITIDNEYSFKTEEREYVDISGVGRMEITVSASTRKPIDFRYMEHINDKSYIEDTEMIMKVKDLSDQLQYRVIIYDQVKY